MPRSVLDTGPHGIPGRGSPPWGRPRAREWAASLTFNSQQDPAVSATHTACTTWGVTFYLVPVGTSYLIGPPPPGYQASALPCG